jgi:hypothetical protein
MMLYAYLVWDYCQDHPIVSNGPFWPDWFNSEADGDEPNGEANSPPDNRPDGVPSDFVKEGPSKKGDGEVYVNPENPLGDRIRVMPGNPDSPNPAQREPYAKVTKGGKVVDANGNPVSGPRPSTAPEAHISLGDLPGIFE